MSGTRAAERARRLLERPAAWLDYDPAGYAVRLGADRRARVVMRLDEAAFRLLVQAPGLRLRSGGGWTARPVETDHAGPAPGRPGVVEGQRPVMEANGRLVLRPANLGETPIAWLLRRKDKNGRPWLTPAQAAAGERLTRDAEMSLSGPSMTMRWDALPRSAGASSARVEPTDRALAASRRVHAALAACGKARGMVDRVCVRGRSLQLAEGEMGLRRRQGRVLLIDGLEALAAHYGLT